MLSPRLVVFLRVPQLGAVKTRLAESIGAPAALAAYRELLAATLAEVAELPEVELRYTPHDGRREIEGMLQPGWQCHPQGDGDLGQRLARAVGAGMADGRSKVAVIGSDCPYLTAADVREAWQALENHDGVLGPATDGGYWLVALRSPQPALFEGIPWGQPTVLAETVRRAAGLGLRIARLRVLGDVDTAEDWQSYLLSKGLRS